MNRQSRFHTPTSKKMSAWGSGLVNIWHNEGYERSQTIYRDKARAATCGLGTAHRRDCTGAWDSPSNVEDAHSSRRNYSATPSVLGKDSARVIPQSGAAGNRLDTAHDQEDQRHPAGCEKSNDKAFTVSSGLKHTNQIRLL